MHLSKSLALKLGRSIWACLAALTAWALLDHVVLTPAAAQAPPAGAAPAQPPAGRAGGGRGRGRALTPYAQAKVAEMRAPLEKITPVTVEMLRNPPAGDWLHWRRTYDGWAYSPLTQINRNN